tara:strand:+ start:3808 stop:5310 length:1503 start_codon:yes stop_codon:yes gene_type:complete
MKRISYIFLGVILYYPAWIFKSGLSFFEIIISSIILYIIPLIFHFFIFKLQEKFYLKSFFFYLASIFTYSLDQNYGIMSFIDNIPNFLSIKIYALYIYISALIAFLTATLLIFLFIYILKYNGIKIIFVFSFVALAVNVFDDRNANYFEKNYYRENNTQINFNKNKTKTLIIVLDEMSGINSFESNHKSGLIVKENLENLFKKWKFIYYKNADTLSHSTGESLTYLLNFKYDRAKAKIYSKKYVDGQIFIEQDKKYFLVENNIKQNLFFDSLKTNNITVFQSMYLNFCGHEKVKACYQYNPFYRNYNYLRGVKNPSLSRTVSLWKLQGSIISNFIWRFLRFGIIDNTLEPYGQKMTAKHFFSDLQDSILKNSSDVIFAHTLIPHGPYGFDEKCNYDGSRSMYKYRMTIELEVIQNNIERNCVVNLLDEFFEKLEDNKIFSKLNIVILSDHGSRIAKDFIDQSYRSAIFAVKKNNENYFASEEKLSIQYLFSKYFNKQHID